jgi:hypothetical protein
MDIEIPIGWHLEFEGDYVHGYIDYDVIHVPEWIPNLMGWSVNRVLIDMLRQPLKNIRTMRP